MNKKTGLIPVYPEKGLFIPGATEIFFIF